MRRVAAPLAAPSSVEDLLDLDRRARVAATSHVRELA